MRIVIPNFPVPDSFADNVAYTLRSMSHEVLTPKYVFGPGRGKISRLLSETIGKAFPKRWTPAEQWVAAAARRFRPHLVLCLTQSLREEVLIELKTNGVKSLVAWWGDSPANMRGLDLLSEVWDKIYLKDASAVAKFRTVGLDAELLHEAMNPDWHTRVSDTVSSEIAIVGNFYGYRQYVTKRLLEKNVPVALYGPPPPRWSDYRILQAHRGHYVVKHQKSRVFGEALGCLNSTSLAEGDSLNCRAFEIAGACGLQFAEDKKAIGACFEPGAEILVFRSVAELVELWQRAIGDPAWAMRIREAGHSRAVAHHTYRHRLVKILGSIPVGD